jgi:hypothetical protein
VKCESCEIGHCTAQSFFGSAIALPSTFYPAYQWPVVADLDLDGYLDLVIAGYPAFGSPAPILILNGSDGGFRPSTTLNAGDSITSELNAITAGDFNGDGLPDLAVAWSEYGDAGTVSFIEAAVYFGLGDAGFYLQDGGLWVAGPFVLASSSDYILGMAAGDFNGDGRDDFVVLGEFGGVTAFYQADGGFTQAPIQTGIDAGSLTSSGPWYGSLTTGDLNADGRADLVVGMGSGGPVIALIAVDGDFVSVPISQPANNYYEAPALAVGPDGLLHVASDQLRTFEYRGASSGFVKTGEYALPNGFLPYSYLQTAAVADFNGDGQADFVASSGPEAALWLRNDGGYDHPVPVPWVSEIYGMGVGALNGDTLPDFVFLSYGVSGVLTNNANKCSP